MTAPHGSEALQSALAERFLRYSAIASQSDASAVTVPTSEGQRELAQLLQRELEQAGANDVHLSETAVLTATIPSTLPAGTKAPVIGFCTHLDTVDVDLSPQVNAQVVHYQGGDLLLNPEQDIWLRVAEDPAIERYIGDRIVVTDGTSVLGADDKAGVAAVMEAAVRLLTDPSLPHGEVRLAFVPDEEIGLRGVRTLELERFPVDHAYTIDSCELGEIVESTFNAASATVTITGVVAHPMSAKGVLVNPNLLAHRFIAGLDPAQTPEMTDGREGYIWVHDMVGSQSTAQLTLAIRDHDAAGFEEKKERVRTLAQEIAEAEPRARIEVEIQDVYANIADARTEQTAHVTEGIREAMGSLGITPIELDMRGGTDGSWLSQQGIFTPNFFTGAHSFHSPFEFLPLPSFERSHLMVMELIARTGRERA